MNDQTDPSQTDSGFSDLLGSVAQGAVAGLSQYYGNPQVGYSQPASFYQYPSAYAPGGYGPAPGSSGAGFSINPTTLLLIGGVILIVVLSR